jgi:hypothetical protein
MNFDHRSILQKLSEPVNEAERLFREERKRWEEQKRQELAWEECKRRAAAVLSPLTVTARLMPQPNKYLQWLLHVLLDPPWRAILMMGNPAIERLYTIATSWGAMDAHLRTLFDEIARLQNIEVQAQMCRDILAVSCADGVRQQEAISRLLSHMKLGLRTPRAARALRRRAASRHISPQDLLRTEIFPPAMLLVNSTAAAPRRIRLGRNWVTNDHGNVQEASPTQEITVWAFAELWFNKVYATAAAILLDQAVPLDAPDKPYSRRPAQLVQLVLVEEDALERLAAPEAPGARDSAMLTALLQTDEADPADQLHRLLTVASPRARELFKLLTEDLSIKEAAAVLGMTPSTAYVHYHRTRKKLRRR